MNDGLVVWFTGLSGSGKSTLAARAAGILKERGLQVEILDGDALRQAQGAGLDFSREGVLEIHRIAVDTCREKRKECDVLLVPRVSPLKEARERAREDLKPFMEVYVKASLESVRRRDPKGLYAKADRKEISPMIGTPGALAYQPPEQPDLTLDTDVHPEEKLASLLAHAIFNWHPK